MSRQTEIVRRWIDSLPEGALIRSRDLEHLVNRAQASRELTSLAKVGRLMRVARGMYVAVTATQPRRLNLMWFQRNRLPVDWQSQRAIIDGFK